MAAAELTIRRLRWHAGLITVGPGTSGPSVDELLCERKSSAVELRAALDDLLGVMQSLNVEINGASPSDSVQVAADEVPRAAAYAISEITSRLRARDESDAAWAVDVAWNGVLAGDIDDIRIHVQQEGDAAG